MDEAQTQSQSREAATTVLVTARALEKDSCHLPKGPGTFKEWGKVSSKGQGLIAAFSATC